MYLDKCINYSVTPIRGDHRYIYLYETTNKCNGNIYVGVRVYRGLDPYKDRYIGNGCGILKCGRLYKRRGKETKFRRALSEFGFLNFEKRIICFFTNIDDALKSEENIVNEDFLKRPDVLNMVVGGGFPPVGEGECNNNYGKHWTEAQKRRLSRKRRKNGKSKGGRNPKAKPCFVYDLWNEEWRKCEYLHELSLIDKEVKSSGIGKIRKFRWLITPMRFSKKELTKYVEENLDEKYQKTYKIIQLLKQGKTEEDIVKLGFYRAHVRRLLNRYDKSN